MLCSSSVVGSTYERCFQSGRTVARIANHGKMLSMHVSIEQRDVFGVNLDKILRIADARPATVVHEAKDLVGIPSNVVQRQAVAIVVTGCNWRTGHGAETCKHVRQLFQGELFGTLQKKSRPPVAGCISIAVLEDVVVLAMQVASGCAGPGCGDLMDGWRGEECNGSGGVFCTESVFEKEDGDDGDDVDGVDHAGRKEVVG